MKKIPPRISQMVIKSSCGHRQASDYNPPKKNVKLINIIQEEPLKYLALKSENIYSEASQ